MKKILFFLTAVIISLTSMAQGKSQGKAKGKSASVHTKHSKPHSTQTGKAKVKSEGHNQHNKTIWNGTTGGNAGKYSKNQPAKVREAFSRDYPNATNVVWSKYQGDWTATFGNGLWGTKTAVYHANGERRDTRSVINRSELPGGGSIWDKIFKRDGITANNQVVQVESPGIMDKIFRVGSISGSALKYLFYNQNGNQVQYNY